MRLRTRAFALALFAMGSFAVPAVAQPPSALLAQPVTPRSAVASHDFRKVTVNVPEFRLGGRYNLDDPASFENGGVGGTTLESLGAGPLRMSYIATGTPKRDAEGRIVNAIVIPSYYSGDSTNMYEQWVVGTALSGAPVIGPGRLIDTDHFYVVMFDAIGLWGASKPSEGLGMRFPQYSYHDNVQAQYRVLRDQLNVGRVALVTGVSMGATQTHLWGVMHSPSGFVQAVMPVGGTTQEDGGDPVRAWVFQLATDAIESDPVWRQTRGNYYNMPKEEHPNQGVAFSWSVLLNSGYTFDFRATQPWDAVRRDVFYWNPPTETDSAGVRALAASFDAVDLIYRNRTGQTYNINEDLGRSRARTLVLHVTTDQWLPYRLAERAVERIPGAQLIGRPHPLAHYGIFPFPNTVSTDPVFLQFMRDVRSLAEPDRIAVRNFRWPSVAAQIDPARSFWRDHVTYPFPVKQADVQDGRGRSWSIGYMDEYAGTEPNPPVLVIIHGKGAFGAHYGNVMRHALSRGMRVIVPDLPHYGMSGPPNLGREAARSLQDMREAIHDLVVNRLGVRQAHWMGHSLGGQFVMGVALSWPDAVQSLVLEAPSGLEEYPAEIQIGGQRLALFDPALANDFARWRQVWGPTGLLDAEMNRTEQGVRDMFAWRTRDAAGNVRPASSGYFLRDSPYARLHTEQRVGMIRGNRAEFEQWVTAYILDVYSIGAEVVRGDRENLLQRLIRIRQPIFLAFGAREPYIPAPALNGLTDLANQVITPFLYRMASAGNEPTVKIYPDVGHFIHTDEPVQFPVDVVDFVLTGRVATASPAAVDRLVRGGVAPAAGSAPAETGPAPSSAGLNK
ncbi:alpha/beta hydrolase [Sabulicella rubraurantiaca]|uniref:alpha/beta hydrolase n=1 Tax=Sabulicella rubraurantiaca TaxID=2811429 RepID=UPI001A9745E7|nr:alpha/beta hydrolase [Sabulicella rubraurantiaca]